MQQRRCDRNRKRSKRRAIYCSIHGCYLDSASPKYQLYADLPGQLQERGMTRRNAQILVTTQTAATLEGEWLEAFWCNLCQKTKWYHVKKRDRIYEVSLAPEQMWQQVTGITYPSGNPTVSEFTRRQARSLSHNSYRDFQFQG
jgi:hypothetical protein